jgi:hypothetical protein
MTNVKVLELDEKRLKENGYSLEEKNGILTIRNSGENLLVEIIYVDEDNILISTKYDFSWVKEVETVTITNGALLVLYVDDCGRGNFLVNN